MRKFLAMAVNIDNDLMGLVYAKLVYADTPAEAMAVLMSELPPSVYDTTEFDVTDMSFNEIRAIRIATRDRLKEDAC